MNMKLSDVAISTFVSGLDALRTMIDKATASAEERNIAPAVMLDYRLTPDMFGFREQVQTALSTSNKGIARLLNREPDADAGDAASFEDLLGRISRERENVLAADRDAIDAGADRVFTVPMGPGRTMEFSARSYLMSFAAPNFLFHTTAAYTVLRHAGVGLGKTDYLAPFIEQWAY